MLGVLYHFNHNLVICFFFLLRYLTQCQWFKAYIESELYIIIIAYSKLNIQCVHQIESSVVDGRTRSSEMSTKQKTQHLPLKTGTCKQDKSAVCLGYTYMNYYTFQVEPNLFAPLSFWPRPERDVDLESLDLDPLLYLLQLGDLFLLESPL